MNEFKSSTNHIELSFDDGVLTITMARAEKKNALTTDMYNAMADALDQASALADCRAIVITGKPGVFCAGNDISDFIKAASGGREGMAPVLRFLKNLSSCDKPLVAAVDGVAVGVGTTMLMHCDLVYSSKNSMFQTPFVDLGLVPEAGSSYLAPRIMGPNRAFELLALGEKFSANDALICNLINSVVENVTNHAREKAHALAQKPPQALKISRDLLRGNKAELYRRMDEEAELFSERLTSGEAQAAFMAFMSKGK